MAEAPNAPKGPRLGRITRTVSFWALLVVMSILLVEMTSAGQRQTEEINYSPQFTNQLAAGNIRRVEIAGGLEGQKVRGSFKRAIPGQRGGAVQNFTLKLPVANSEKLLADLDAAGVEVTGKDANSDWLSWLKVLFPWLIIIGIWVFVFRQMQATGNKAFQFGKSKAKLLSGDTPKVTF
ncbi:MAG: ATP-dependent metallopeptidase FtsH/Yme1/Tma family protein, partial [Longimicrobiaceae bacterium]